MKNRRLLGFIFFHFFLLAFIFPFYIDGYINPHDEGVWLAAIQALLEGKHLYRDIWLQYNPLLPWLAARIAACTTPTLSVIRGTFWVLNALGLLCISCAAYRFIEDDLTLFISVLWLWLVPASAQFRCIPMSARYGAGFLPMLAWPVNSPEGRKKGSARMAGLLAGLAFWIAQEVGLAALVGGGIIFALERRKDRSLMEYLGCAALVLAIGGAVIAVRDGLFNYLQSAVIQTAQIVRAQRLPFPSLGFFGHPLVWQNLGGALAFYGPALSYGLILAWCIRGSNRLRGPKATAAGLAVYGILTASSAWGRTDLWHIYFAISPALFLWAYGISTLRKENQQRGDLFLMSFIVMGGLMTLPYLFARQMHSRNMRMVQRSSSLPRMGSVQLPYWEANGYEYLVNWIDRKTRPGEPILFFPYDGAIYFLANRPNPCRLPILTYAVRDSMQDEAVQEIEQARVPWVIVDQQNNAFDGVPIRQYLSHVDRYIRTHYVPQEGLGPFFFLKRKEPAPAA